MPPESLRCKECKTTYPLDARYVCERCFGPLEVAYADRSDADPAALRRRTEAGPHSLWRYSDFLPVQAPSRGVLPAGLTPLLRADRLAEQLGLREVWIKNDAANPTHSFKDRVVSVALARARELGFTTVACASTGNLANAVAAQPSAAARASYRVVAPIASGSLFTKIARGFEEWLELGLLEGELPIFHGAQAAGCSPVATAFQDGHDFCQPVKPDTIAKSLAIGNPADGPYALDLARGTKGSIESVTDDEIREGIRLLAQTTGIFTETAGGVTVAVLAKPAERGEIDPDERVGAYITGQGLKTLGCARGTFETWEIEPTLTSFEQAREQVVVPA